MTPALGERLGDLGPELRLHRLRKRAATRPHGTGIGRGRPPHLARLWHEPQPKTGSHDGVCADQPGARTPRCTPADLHHVAMLSTGVSHGGRHVLTAPEPSAWEVTASRYHF